MSRLERAIDPLMWVWCWLAFRLTRTAAGTPAFMWLLPFAGFYAYHEPGTGTTWRWSERVR